MGLNIRIRELGFEFLRLMDGLIVVSAASIESTAHYYAEVGCAIDDVGSAPRSASGIGSTPYRYALRIVGGTDAYGT